MYVERTVGSSRYEYTYTDRNGSTKITSEDIKESKDCEKEDCTITRNYVAYTKYISNILVNNRK